MSHEPILAKSRQYNREVTLAEHIRDVLRAVTATFGHPSGPRRLAREWLRFFGLGADDFGAFYHHLWIAAALHDAGKASSSYQRAIRHEAEQLIRHEHISALLLWQEPLCAWLHLLGDHGIDPDVIAAAVVSHHLKVNDKEFAAWLVESSQASIEVYLDAPDVPQILALAAEQFAVPSADLGGIARRWDRQFIQRSRERFGEAMARFNRALKRDERRWRLLLAVKAALVAVDSAGSAVRRMDQSLEEWLGAAFDQAPLTEADVEEDVITPRVEELRRHGRWRGFHDFQIAAGTLGPRGLLLSGCGTGKTLAAWKWIASQLRQRPASRVIFLYPTRATATEGFRDYVSWSGPEAGKLMHGTSRYDLEGMFENPGDPRRGGDYTVPERLFALGYWHGRYFSATVDSFLALMANRYAALCMAPVLADSVVVFDEVHSFDNNMFRALERFLTFFDVPALCMTASLPTDRIRVLRGTCKLEAFPRELERFADLRRQSEALRYRVRWIDERDADDKIREAVAGNKRVLWVANTVPRCQEIAERLTGEFRDRVPVRCYHSRFRLKDRRDRHREAITLLGSEGAGPAVLVTTQVCEMSLDLDADVLITEAADVPAIIQRMGRCCREPVPQNGRIGEVYLYPPKGALPYEPREVADGAAFARELASRDLVSQADLAAYLGRMAATDPFAVGGFTGFLDSGWYAMSRDDSFREDDDLTVSCVLDADLDAYLLARAARNGEEAGFILPVPRRFVTPQPKLGQYIREAPASHYDCRRGFLLEEVKSDG